MDYYQRALQMQNETVVHRRYLHQNAETGLDMPKAVAYVMQKLTEYGITPRECGKGVTGSIGSGGKTILLRADMDALPMCEESGLDFACPTGKAAHCCGHDLHTAMLLSAAKLLKQDEAQLAGTVRLMFQPAEETFEGAANMIAAGILQEPVPDAAMACHVGPGNMPPGMYLYNDSGQALMFSVDTFEIRIQGQGAHGAYPHTAVDPINIGVHIYLALQELVARECDPNHACVVTVGQFDAGFASNTIPETGVLRGTIRADRPEARQLLVKRVQEVAAATAQVYGGTAQAIMTRGVPPLLCDPALTREMTGYLQQLSVPDIVGQGGITASASEDFALIAERIPSTYLYLTAGFTDARGIYRSHNPKVQFHEDVLPIGVAALAHCAAEWLKQHR